MIEVNRSHRPDHCVSVSQMADMRSDFHFGLHLILRIRVESTNISLNEKFNICIETVFWIQSLSKLQFELCKRRANNFYDT